MMLVMPRFLAGVKVAAATTVTALAFATPASADPVTDVFLGALSNAGVGYNDPAVASSLGESICPMLQEPGGNFARAVSKVNNTDRISPDTAALFTSIAISVYCPTMLTSLANGDWLSQLGSWNNR